MVLIPKKNLIINSDNVCYANIIAEDGKLTNKMSTSFVGGEKLCIEFLSVETCKTFFNQIASAIHGCTVYITDNDEKSSILYGSVQEFK